MEDEYTFSGLLEISTNKLWGAHIAVPRIIAQTLLSQDGKRVVARLNDLVEFQCGLIPKGEGEVCIMINKKIRTQLALKEGSRVQVRLTKDNSAYGLPVPEEFEAVLQEDEEGRGWFEALTAGKKRTLLYIAGHVKDSDKRIARALAIVDHLKANSGSINFRELNTAIKEC